MPAPSRPSFSRLLVAGGVLSLVLLPFSARGMGLAAPVPLPSVPVPTPSLPVPGGGGTYGAPVSSCQFRGLAAGEVRTLYQARDGNASVSAAVDPAAPCHIFRSAGSRLLRSDSSSNPDRVVIDGGQVNSQIPGRTFRAGTPTFSRASTVYVPDQSGGNGIYFSADEGQSVSQVSPGPNYPVNPAQSTVRQMVFAPSNPDVGFAVVDNGGGSTLLYRTTDAGRDWTALSPPTPVITTITVDPGDERHVLVADGGINSYSQGQAQPVPAQPGGSLLFDSHDGGDSFTARPGPTDGSPAQLLAARSRNGALFLYALCVGTGTGLLSYELWVSRDGGATWEIRPTPGLDPNAPATIAAVPRDGTVAMAAGRLVNGGQLWVEGTGNGFSTASARSLDATGTVGLSSQGSAALGGMFFLDVVTGGVGALHDQMLAFNLASLLPPPPPPNPGSLVKLKQCPLQRVGPGAGIPPPAPDPGQNEDPNNESAGTYHSGSLAFDGRILYYSDAEADPGGVLRIEASTCALKPRLALRPGPGSGLSQGLLASEKVRALAWDLRYELGSGKQGALLAQGDVVPASVPDPEHNAPVLAIDPDTGDTELATYVFAPNKDQYTSENKNPTAFAYDQYQDRLFAPVAGVVGNAPPAARPGLIQLPRVRGAAPTIIPSCIGDYNGLSSFSGSSTFVVGADGVLYDQQEDDRTVLETDIHTCTPLPGRSFPHSQYSEGYDENDQIACDPRTFAAGSAAAGTSDVSALWIRNVRQNNVTAFSIPNSFCPFIDYIKAEPPARSLVNQPVVVCANLSGRIGSSVEYLANQVISFSIASGGSGVSAPTDADRGHGCATVQAPSKAGLYTVTARYPGSHTWVPVSDTTSLEVTANLLPPVLAIPPAFFSRPQPPPPPGPAPLPLPNPVIQPQAQPQPQPQPQTQAQAQAAPMTQRQKQAQVAVQTVSGGEGPKGMEAIAVRLGHPDGVVLEQVVAGLVFGAALVAIRPRRRYGLARIRSGPARTRTRR